MLHVIRAQKKVNDHQCKKLKGMQDKGQHERDIHEKQLGIMRTIALLYWWD
jgi:hypothetical protein